MEALGSIRCSGCGAGLPVEPQSEKASCLFCGATVAVDRAAVRAHAELPAAAGEAEREGLDALAAAIELKLGGGPARVIVALIAVLAATATCIAAGVQLIIAFRIPQPVGMIFVVATTACIPIAMVFLILWNGARSRRRAREATDELRGRVAGQPQKSKCTSCGGPVMVPPRTAVLRCAFCDAPLLATLGMLVAWVDDATQRKERWKAEARALIERVGLRHKVEGVLSPLLVLGLSPCVLAVVVGGVSASRGCLGMSQPRLLGAASAGATAAVPEGTTGTARYQGGAYFPAVVVARQGDGLLQVVYADGDVATIAAAELAAASFGVGQPIEARNGAAWEAATVRQRHGGALLVAPAGGAARWVSLAAVRGLLPGNETSAAASPRVDREGASVLSPWRQTTQAYPATVVETRPGQARVVYWDGTEEWKAAAVLRPDTLGPGAALVDRSLGAVTVIRRLGHALEVRTATGATTFTSLARVHTP